MNKFKIFASGVTLTLAFVFFFSIGNAYATTGCFPDTNGHWAETFICWLKDNAITSGYPDGTYKPNNNVSRAEMAVFLQKTHDKAVTNAVADAVSQAGTMDTALQTSGDIRIVAGPSSWEYNGSANAAISTAYYTGGFDAIRSNAGTVGIQLAPALPTKIYNYITELKSVEICYEVSATAYIDAVYLQVWSAESPPTYLSSSSLSDTTDRTANECRTFTLTTPTQLPVWDYVVLYLQLNFTAPGTVTISRTTFTLSATTRTSDYIIILPSEGPNETHSIDNIPGAKP